MEESNQKGWIKLYRKMLKWRWYDDAVVKSAFIHCILMANITDTEWHQYDIPKGGFITSLPHFSEQCGITVNQTRRALKCLEETGEITKKPQGRNTLIIVNNLDKFQSKENLTTGKPQDDHRITTGSAQDDHRMTTTDKEYKNIRNKELKNNTLDHPDMRSDLRESEYSSEPDIQSRFDRLWDLYPKKQGKQKAFEAYKKAIRDGASDEDIEAGIRNYAFYIEKTHTEQRYIKQGSTWFNQRCWNDDYVVSGSRKEKKKDALDSVLEKGTNNQARNSVFSYFGIGVGAGSDSKPETDYIDAQFSEKERKR